jgi:hypothetical protein
MTILIDPEKAQVDAIRDVATEQARLARAQEEANRLKQEELYLSSLTLDEKKAYFAEKQRLEEESEKALNEFLIKAFKILGIVIVVITLYVWLK